MRNGIATTLVKIVEPYIHNQNYQTLDTAPKVSTHGGVCVCDFEHFFCSLNYFGQIRVFGSHPRV